MIGQTISHYKILEKLGEGGMGVVYKAQDLKLGRFVALKFLLAPFGGSEEQKKRFIREAQAASALDHPNVCTVYEIDETPAGQTFICMAYYEGEPLNKKLERGYLTLEEVLDFGLQIAQGLAKAHQIGIIHRDVKPANVLITKEGSAKILDFGLAKLTGKERLTKSGLTTGTVAYMSPEQVTGQEVDQRSDVFSFGILLYEMATGRLPFGGEYEAALLYDIVHTPAPPLKGLRPDFPEGLEQMVNKALAKKKEHRYPSMTELWADLKKLQTGVPVSVGEVASVRPRPAVRGNLPRQLTSFVGRVREKKETRLRLENTGLLTLTGPGGCGKTRLALQVASELQGEYPDDVWLVELAALTDPTLVAKSVASVFTLKEESNRPIFTVLSEHLKPRNLLLVLDNCEHLIEACAQLTENLLKHCSHLRILTTSREPLGVAGETVFKVPPLSFPDLEKLPVANEDLISTLKQSEAIQLFIERAASASPGFTLTPENAVVVTKVCRQLDGIPLAIELAAARLKTLTVEQIYSRLDDRFSLLTTGSRTALPHRQTLKAAIDWSFDLLSEKEQILFRRLTVFAGGWTLEEAESVCTGADLDAHEILNLLAYLVDKSMVVQAEWKEERWFHFLETIRQYGWERLQASGETNELRRRHRDCFLVLAERAEPELSGEKQTSWLQRLEAEHDNLRAALSWCQVEKEGLELGLRLGGALSRFWEMHGHFAEGRRWLENMLQGAGGALETFRAKANLGAGMMAWNQADYDQASFFFNTALVLYRKLGDKEGVAISLNNLGKVAWVQGNYKFGTELFEECLSIWQELKDDKRIAATLTNLGVIVQEQQEYDKARQLYERSLAISRKLKDQQRIANALNNLGNLVNERGDCRSAHFFHDEALAIRRELGDKDGVALSLNNLGDVAFAQGDFSLAQSFAQESLTKLWELGDKRVLVGPLETLGNVAKEQGDFARAARQFGAVEALREAIGTPMPPFLQPEFERSVTALRAALGKEAFATEWKKGRAMTLEEAVQYALSFDPTPGLGLR